MTQIIGNQEIPSELAKELYAAVMGHDDIGISSYADRFGDALLR